MKNSKFILFVILGIIFWFNAAMIVRLVGRSVFSDHNVNLIFAFIIAIPLTIVSILITKSISGFRYSQLLKPVAIMTFTATFLDGIALAWFRELYSNSFEVALFGAAWILWGAGLGLLFSYFLEINYESKKNT